MAVIDSPPTAPTSEIRSTRRPSGPLRWVREHIIPITGVLVLFYMFLPIFVVILFSFNQPKGRFNYQWVQFSTDAWTNLCEVGGMCEALRLSLVIGVVATLGSVVLGTLVAFAIGRHRFRGRSATNLLVFMPMATPEVVMGSSLLTLFVTLNWSRGFITIVIAQVMFSVSYVATTVRARIRGFDWRLEEAAADLGASPMRTFTKVTLPLIAPGVVAAALLTFALSLDDFIITYLNSGLENTFPIQIWNMKRSRIPVQINVFSTALLIISLNMAALVIWQGRRRQKKLDGVALG